MRRSFYIVVACLCLFVSGEPDLYWRQFNGEIPFDAVAGSTGAYIAQVVLPSGGIALGTIYSGRKVAITVVDNKEYEASEHVKILCSNSPTQFSWRKIQPGDAVINTQNLVDGGVEEGNQIYIGRICHDGTCKIGKVYRTLTLNVWMCNGSSAKINTFELLEHTPEEGGTGTKKYQAEMLADQGRRKIDIRGKLL